MKFTEAGANNIVGYQIHKGSQPPPLQLDSIENVSLIYISGGNQNNFMEIVKAHHLPVLILMAYVEGTVIAGTSTGAAVMSKKMITENELKHAYCNETFRNIEANNIKLAEGTGLLEHMSSWINIL